MSYIIPNIGIFIAGVLLTATCLVTEMCELNPEIVTHFRRVSELVFGFLCFQ